VLPDEPLFALIPALQTLLGDTAKVMGERPADLVGQLPVVVLTRRGGTAIESAQALLGDRPIIFADVYAIGADQVMPVMQDVRRAMRGLGARENTGPVPTPDADEAAGVRRLTASWRYATH
jgi:hypothetical protein